MKILTKKLSYAIYIVLATVLIMGCDSNEGALGWSNSVNSEGLKSSYKTIEIEGCEYIMYDAGSGYAGNGFLAHKGNCKNH